MTNEEIVETLNKLTYHVSLLGETINYNQHPIEALILSKNWGREDINKAHDIFEKWDGLLENGGKMSTSAFERDFKVELGLSYQGLKSVVLAFYRNHQWTNVCEAYVDAFGSAPSMEFHSIMRRER
ncbi:hypothetical protein [Brucella inopinata]|uniref:hypothetical protein n=1 Tax=Brucella inopinata TaxID=1218315 RepID=UPI0008710644|nr:hypothetical protein [Brucella inopinata]SCD25502.1 hypothetical protein BR141012304_21043 [Brucella inopinata]